VTLGQIAPEEKFRFLYHYGCGDDWEHEVLVEKILPREEGKSYPFSLGENERVRLKMWVGFGAMRSYCRPTLMPNI